ncbi:MAG: FHA domain-containing protein [Ilumatobacter sp.]|uniref:FHA domain-containing protein n=1 Tax=Ilumatobacter sp. TaxID=1967498 RepID=UPI0039196971
MAVHARLRRVSTGDLHDLVARTTSIGRDPDHPISIAVSAVSRDHAEIERTDHSYLIRDLGSRNGTFVDGSRVDREGRPLRDGDLVVIAGVESFRFIDPMATPGAPAIGRLIGVWIDPETRAVWVDAQRVEPPLSSRQQVLIELLDRHRGNVVSRACVVDVVWADVAAEGVSAEAVDALVKRLKARLRPLQMSADYVEVVRGRGLRLAV